MWVDKAVNKFNGMADRARRKAGDLAGRVADRLSTLAARVQEHVDKAVARFGNMAARINRTIGSIWDAIKSKFTDLVSKAAIEVDNIVDAFRGLGARILAAIGEIVIRPVVKMPSIPGTGGGNKWPESTGDTGGGSGSGGSHRGVADDPAVNVLTVSGSAAMLPAAGGGKVVNASGWQIVSPCENPRLVGWVVVLVVVGWVV
jgi:hypothetical protein